MRLKLGLIGASLSHSFSKQYFDAKFKNSENEYSLIPLAESELENFLKSTDLDGFNITIPYKEKILAYPCKPSEAVSHIGASNCFLRKNGKWHAYNTDVKGIADTFSNYEVEDKKVLILGTGGSSKALAYYLWRQGIPFQKVSRDSERGDMTYPMLDASIMEEYKIIVNTTPLGMYPEIESFVPIPYQYLSSNHICIDFVYNPEETEFLKKAKAQSAQVQNGMQMLISQAEESFRIWSNTDPCPA